MSRTNHLAKVRMIEATLQARRAGLERGIVTERERANYSMCAEYQARLAELDNALQMLAVHFPQGESGND